MAKFYYQEIDDNCVETLYCPDELQLKEMAEYSSMIDEREESELNFSLSRNTGLIKRGKRSKHKIHELATDLVF